MNTQFNSQYPTNPIPEKYQTVRYGMFLGIVGACMAGFLFPFLYFFCQQTHETFGRIEEPVRAIWIAFLVLGPLFISMVALLPAIVGGGILGISLRILLRFGVLSLGMGILLGTVAGGLYGYVLTQIVEWLSHLSRFTPGPLCGRISGTLAGVTAGSWYGYKMTFWLRGQSQHVDDVTKRRF